MAELRLQGIRPLGLEPVNLRIGADERVFLSGPSGAGKSLLLRAVADLDPHPGEAFVGDIPRSSLTAPDWRRRVALLPAEPGWWAETVGEHVPTCEPLGRLDLLGQLGFDADVLRWQVGRLSTGERQRLALARLLTLRPEALLLDEPTANLDPVNRERAEKLITDYQASQGAAVLWVSHDPEQRRRLGTRSLVIDGGRLRPEDTS
jgi:putative ABC transport system ATP-binding protein